MSGLPDAAGAAERGWHVVGRTRDLEAPGTVVPAVLAEGALDEPIILLRDSEGRLRAMSNVCTHRGHLLVDRPRQDLRTIQCPYHGRCFALDGRVVRSPGFDGIAPDALEPLPSVSVATWGPLVFASLNGPTSFPTWIQGPQERLGFLDPDKWVFVERTVYEVDAHWTVYVENYLEGLHIPFVHPALAREVDWRAYRYVLQAQGNLQVAESQTGPRFALPVAHPDVPDGGRGVSAFYFWLFPTTMLNIYPWGLSLNVVIPQGTGRSRVVFESYVGDPTQRGQGAGSGLDDVEREDEAVVSAVQIGMRARLFRPGRLSPTHEVCVDHFRRLLADQG